jgi:SAM-dependent methyltransferase
MASVEERFSPQGLLVPPWVRAQHIERYRWASSLVAGLRVIDAACGAGYGSKMLADAGAERVDGFDVAAAAVRGAREAYGTTARLRFDVADATRLPVPDHAYDLYVSFETIEHVEDDRALLAEAARVLKPGGKFVCSTPNRSLLDPGRTIADAPFNPHHVREYVQEEFDALLRTGFRHVEYLGQSQYSGQYVKWLGVIGERFPMAAVRLHQLRKLCSVPWQRASRCIPAEIEPAAEPEVLIAVAT